MDMFTTESVPFSCCNIQVMRPCIDFEVTNSDIHPRYSAQSDNTLTQVGCSKKLADNILNIIIPCITKYGYVIVITEVWQHFYAWSYYSYYTFMLL